MYVQNPQLSQQIQDKLSDRIQDLHWMQDQIDIEEYRKFKPDTKDEKLVEGRAKGCWYGNDQECPFIKDKYWKFILSNKEQEEINDKVSQQTLDELIDAMDNLEDSKDSDIKPQKFGCASVRKLSTFEEEVAFFNEKKKKLQSLLEETKKFNITDVLVNMEKSKMLELATKLLNELRETKTSNNTDCKLKDSLKDAIMLLRKAEGEIDMDQSAVRTCIIKCLRFMLRAKKNRIVYNNFTNRLRKHIKKSLKSFAIKNDELALMIGKENFYEIERLSNDINVEKMELENNIFCFNEQLQFISTDGSKDFLTSNFKLPRGSFKTQVFKKLFVDQWFECKFNDAFSKPDEGLDFVNEFTKDYIHNCLKALRCLKRDLKEQNETLGQFKHVSIETQEKAIIEDFLKKPCDSEKYSDVDDCESESESQSPDLNLLNYAEMSEGLIFVEKLDKIKKLIEMEGEDKKEEAEDEEEEAEDKKEEAEVQKEAEDKEEAAEGEDESEDKKEEAEVQKESKGSKKTVKMLSDDEFE